VPLEAHNRIARFLEMQGFKEEALAVATDPEHQFELAVQLAKLQTAYEITLVNPSEPKWKQLGDLALVSGNLELAEECLVCAADLPGLLLLYTSTGRAEGVERLAELARKKGKLNISFLCSFLRGNTDGCLQLLLGAGRAPEAAFLARTYVPSRQSDMVQLWREQLRAVNPKAAESIANPLDYPNLFDGQEFAVKAEEWVQAHGLHGAAASLYLEHAADNESDLIEHMKLLAVVPPVDPSAMPPEASAPPNALAPEPELVSASAPVAAVDELEAQLDAELAQDAAAESASDLDVELDAELEAELGS